MTLHKFGCSAKEFHFVLKNNIPWTVRKGVLRGNKSKVIAINFFPNSDDAINQRCDSIESSHFSFLHPIKMHKCKLLIACKIGGFFFLHVAQRILYTYVTKHF